MARRTDDSEQEFEDLSAYSSAGDYKARQRGRRSVTATEVAVTVICALLLILGIVMIYISTVWMEGRTATAVAGDPGEPSAASTVVTGAAPEAVPLEPDAGGRAPLLLEVRGGL